MPCVMHRVRSACLYHRNAASLRFVGNASTNAGAIMACAYPARSALALLSVLAPLAFANDAGAQPDVASYYRGRTVQAVVGYTPGSTFELYLRTLTRHLGRHIPGGPNVVIQHMPGAGSLNATAYLAGAAA